MMTSARSPLRPSCKACAVFHAVSVLGVRCHSLHVDACQTEAVLILAHPALHIHDVPLSPAHYPPQSTFRDVWPEKRRRALFTGAVS